MSSETRKIGAFDDLEKSLPVLRVDGPWEQVLSGGAKEQLEQLLPQFLIHRRWFGGKARAVKGAKIADSIPVPHEHGTSHALVIDVEYAEGGPETYLLGVSFATAERARHLMQHEKAAVLLRLMVAEGEGVLYDAVLDRDFVVALLDSIDRGMAFHSSAATIASVRTEKFDELRRDAKSVEPRVMGAEQSNTSVVFGERLILKFFRRVEAGINPDFEIGRFLTEHGFFHTPPVAGGLEMRSAESEPRTIGLLEGFVESRGDAWEYTLRSLAESMARAAERRDDVLQLEVPQRSALQLANDDTPRLMTELAGEYLRSAALLGERTGQMHLMLADGRDDPNFRPEPFSAGYQESVYRAMRALATAVLAMMRGNIERIPVGEREAAVRLGEREDELLDLFAEMVESRFDVERIRIHGDYHLGQVLYTGSDFVIIDFEGEPLRSIAERRIKRSPLRDVAGMLRSFDYAAHTVTTSAIEGGAHREVARHFTQLWRNWACAAFVRGYLRTCGGAAIIPKDAVHTAMLLDAFLIDKAVYELGYEINNRPNWVGIPIAGINRILDERAREMRERRRAA